MSMRNSLRELKDFFGYKRRESTTRSKIVRKQLKKEKEQVEYYNFKRVLFQKIDEILYNNEYSKVVLRPHDGKEKYFKLVLDDEDFNRFYVGRMTEGGELEVYIKELDMGF